MKKFLMTILSHLCFWKEFGNEARYSLGAKLPLVIALFLPVAYPTLISLTYSNQTVVERPIVILDQDNSAYSRDLIVSLDATEGAIIKKTVTTIEDGVQEIMSHGADAFVFIPEDFSSRIKHFKQGHLKVYMYATNMMTYASAMTAIQMTVLDKNVQLSVENIANPKGLVRDKAYHVMDPLQNEKNILYAPTLAYASYICPILFVLVFHQMGLLILGFSIGYHREQDEQFRTRKLWYIDYFWRYLYYICFIILGMFVVYKGIVPIFGWPCLNPDEMMKLVLFMVVCQMPLSILLASVCKDRFTSFQYVLGLSLFFFTISGYVWPQTNMPAWCAYLSDILGINPAASAMRKITYKGAMFSDCTSEIVHLIELSKVYFIIALIFVHRDLPVRLIKYLYHRKNTAASNGGKDCEGIENTESGKDVLPKEQEQTVKA